MDLDFEDEECKLYPQIYDYIKDSRKTGLYYKNFLLDIQTYFNAGVLT
jgi:hypothetical protein